MLTRAKLLRLSGLAAAALVIAPEALPKSNDGIVRVKSNYNFRDTIARLKKDIAAKGIRFFSEIGVICGSVLNRLLQIQHRDFA